MSTQDKALYTGTSSRGDIGEALEAAVALARESMQTDIVHWKLVSLEGEYGGFIDSGTTGHLGQWVSLDPSMLQKIDIAWSIFPQTNHETAVARLDASREFIVFLSQDVAAGDCTGARVKPIVDDKPIPDETGADLFLYPNGSIIAIGKTVRLSAEGTCKPGKSLNGAVRLL